jgi:hypothetical protein
MTTEHDHELELRTREELAPTIDEILAAVREQFAECLDLLVSWLLPHGAHTLNDWMDPDDTQRFISSLNH